MLGHSNIYLRAPERLVMYLGIATFIGGAVIGITDAMTQGGITVPVRLLLGLESYEEVEVSCHRRPETIQIRAAESRPATSIEEQPVQALRGHQRAR